MRLTAPSFWWRERAGAGVFLWPFARLWGMGAEWRMARPARFRPPVAVICVGNYVVGGAGKTPTVIALVRLAKAGGMKPGILARGYGGNTAGPLLVDRATHRAAKVGDEALLLAVAAPTVVASDRAAGAKRLLDEGVDVIILDDGFQDPALAKDLALIVVDAAAGVGNGRVMPAGPLRAPLRAQVRATDALLVIGEGSRAQPLIRLAARAGRPVFTASLIPATTREWQKDKILAFAGIGRPQKFFDSLAGVGAQLTRGRSFPDHHPYTEGDAKALLTEADHEGCRLVTTEKDAVRLLGTTGTLAALRDRAEVFAVKLEFDHPAAVGALIAAAVRRMRAA